MGVFNTARKLLLYLSNGKCSEMAENNMSSVIADCIGSRQGVKGTDYVCPMQAVKSDVRVENSDNVRDNRVLPVSILKSLRFVPFFDATAHRIAVGYVHADEFPLAWPANHKSGIPESAQIMTRS